MEKQQGNKEQTVAWFKLAELIARGEREKALNVFRLLSHSLPDRAYALQVEGDILWYFDDRLFTEKYKQAAYLYQKEKRWIDAIAIYEHLLFNNPGSIDLLKELAVYYCMLSWPEKFVEKIQAIISLYQKDNISKDLLDQAFYYIVDMSGKLESDQEWLGHHLASFKEYLPGQINI